MLYCMYCADFESALKLEPGNMVAKTELEKLDKVRILVHVTSYKDIYIHTHIYVHTHASTFA